MQIDPELTLADLEVFKVEARRPLRLLLLLFSGSALKSQSARKLDVGKSGALIKNDLGVL